MLDVVKEKLKGSRHGDVLKASAISFIVRVLGALAGFISTFVIARQLGAEQSGYYFLAFSIVSILAAVSRVGMDNTVIRFVGSLPDQSVSVFYKSQIVAFCCSAFCSLFLFLFSENLAFNIFNKPELTGVFKGMSIGMVGLSLLTLSANSLQGLHRVIASIVVLNILVNLLLVSAVYLLDLTNAVMVAEAYSAFALLTALIGGLLFLHFKPMQIDTPVDWATILKSCMPLWVVVLMAQLVHWAGQFIAGAYVSSEVVAQLAVAQRTAMLASFVLIAVNLVVAPRFAALHKKGDLEGLESLAITSVKLIGVMALPVIGVMLVFPVSLMGLFGADFVEGAVYLQILAVGQFINAITGSVGYLLIMSGHERDMRNIVLVAGVTALSLTWVLTIQYGAFGNAIGTAIAVATQNLLAVYFVKKRLGFNTLAVWR